MSDRKLAKAVQSLLRQIWRLHRSITRAFVTWLLRTALIVNRSTRQPVAGFVLPTTVLLILVVALTTGALTYRAFNTSTRTIAETQNRVIYNAATPAIDRARSKIEFLFDSTKDTRYPGGVPSDGVLTSMLLNASPVATVKGDAALSTLRLAGGGNNGMGNDRDPYTLPDETRIDINGDGQLDNAWRFQVDTDGNGSLDATVAYSVILTIPPDETGRPPARTRLISLTDAQKADGEVIGGRRISYTRSGPLSNTPATGGCATSGGAGSRVEGGWFEDEGNSSVLRKNFQVDAFVVSNNVGTTGASNFTTLELQQDRKLDRGNKWGAWFRNDLEIFPGPQFNWNGAMHTEGNLLIGNNAFSAYLISSPASCLFYESASEISVTSISESRDAGGNVITPAFNGLVASGRINDTSYSGSSLIYLHAPNPTAAANKVTLTPTNDWSNGAANIFQISSDPLAIQVRDRRQSRAANPTNQPYLDPANTGPNNKFPRRIKAESAPAPYVDDTYRADNRYGPKSVYDAQAVVPRGRQIGQLIAAGDNVSPDPSETVQADPKLIAAEAETGADSSTVGLDGYWERRARNEGLRILVGERLELGNSNGWVTPKDQPATRQNPATTAPLPPANPDYSQLRNASYGSVTDASQADPDTSDDEGDPLYPPYRQGNTSLTHEAQQRRALRDNIAAVQSTAVYHAAVSRDYPVACLASTSHPGTPFTLRQSINFVPTFFVNSTPTGIADGDGGSGSGLTSQRDTVLMTDFFNGRGTNGWEFEPPRQTQTQFEADMNNPASSLRIALQNLANFAGDHVSETQTGAFPPTQEAGRVHPYPELTMWGNFSNLRRALAQLNSGTTYANLSPADKTYLQTASCTLGMLAYNIDRVQRFDPRNPFNDRSRPNAAQVMQNLAQDLFLLMDGEVNEPSNPEVLPKQLLATYEYGRSTASNNAFYNARDYDRVPAEAYLGKLREYYLTQGASSFNDAKLRMAELIFEYFQIRRDRTYGFRPSPAANTWNFNPYVTTQSLGGFTHLWSSACDPNIFALNSDAQGRLSGQAAANISPAVRPDLATFRMALSRLCGTVIPAAAVHDYPGDYGLPQRNRNNRGLTPDPGIPNAYLEYIPREGSTLYGYRAPETRSPAPFDDAAGILRAAPYNNGVYLQATVAPKWPSLFYLFPECDHDHLGLRATCNGISTTNGIIDLQGDNIGASNSDGDWSDDLDIRQPTGQLTNLDPSARLGEVLPAAFQPWPEPYITDTYIRDTVNPSPATVYRVVDPGLPSMFVASTYPSYTTTSLIAATDTGNTPPRSLVYRYRVFNNPLDDRPVTSVALRPRKLPTGFSNPFPLIDNPTWELPVLLTNTSGVVPGENAQYRPPNRILVPSADPLRGVVAAIPFLDRVMFSGREWMPLRVMDMDIGLLRRTRPANQGGAGSSPEAYPPDSTTKNDVWLPVSGIVYAFREDAVREDGINRPAGGTVTNATNPSTPTDPALQQVYPDSTEPRISIKPVDGIADPGRRPHGFRLRDASQLARHAAMSIPEQDNIRGLSFFTDDSVFIMGDYNLHQNGTDDQVTGIQRLEEFTTRLPDNANYTEAQFYGRTGRDTRFANAAPDGDRWRPSEILADAISVLSDTLCDGSVIDTFMTTGTGSGATISETTYSGRDRVDSNAAVTIPNGFRPYNRIYASSGTGGVSVYDNRTAGMFGPGCTGANGFTTFLNQNRPSTSTLLNNIGYAWMRENPADIFSPVKISRNGSGLTLPPLDNPPTPLPPTRYNPPSFATNNPATEPSKPRRPVPYTSNPVNGAFYNITNGRPAQSARDTRVNTIIVSGLVPSRQNQSYGGLHNFPRFLERWTRLWFSGAFLQLNFSNYATAPFDQQVWEPGQNPTPGNEQIAYYSPPQRLWGYDVALQLAPAGPAAARFVTPSRDRNEFYSEPPANDPYIRNLCRALPDDVIPDNRCPS